jgi:hypothetical protein
MELDATVDVASRACPVVVPSDRTTANSHPIVKVMCDADAETVTGMLVCVGPAQPQQHTSFKVQKYFKHQRLAQR